MSRTVLAVLIGMGFASPSLAQYVDAPGKVEVLADLNALTALQIPILARADRAGVGYAILTPDMQARLSALNHARGRCAGYEVLPSTPGPSVENQSRVLNQLQQHVDADRRWVSFSPRRFAIPARPEISAALNELSEDNLRAFVTWASSFPTRDNRGQDPNIAVRALVQKLQSMIAPMPRSLNQNIQLELVNHKSTKQQSIRVRIVGRSRPDEIIVLGGHFDSINQSWGGSKAAPGADDNASGSANILEAFRVISARGQLERTVEFYWYAGEESGLLGSAEIAKDYKTQGKKVIAALQLDMTSYPGNGEFVIGSETDYTSAWLRDVLVGINDTYLHAKIVEDQCGYGCSDHASWYRQGYPTLMPFEATLNTMNKRLHTTNDVIFEKTNFKHSHLYSKIAVVFAMELGNTDAHQPYN